MKEKLNELMHGKLIIPFWRHLLLSLWRGKFQLHTSFVKQYLFKKQSPQQKSCWISQNKTKTTMPLTQKQLLFRMQIGFLLLKGTWDNVLCLNLTLGRLLISSIVQESNTGCYRNTSIRFLNCIHKDAMLKCCLRWSISRSFKASGWEH